MDGWVGRWCCVSSCLSWCFFCLSSLDMTDHLEGVGRGQLEEDHQLDHEVHVRDRHPGEEVRGRLTHTQRERAHAVYFLCSSVRGIRVLQYSCVSHPTTRNNCTRLRPCTQVRSPLLLAKTKECRRVHSWLARSTNTGILRTASRIDPSTRALSYVRNMPNVSSKFLYA